MTVDEVNKVIKFIDLFKSMTPTAWWTDFEMVEESPIALRIDIGAWNNETRVLCSVRVSLKEISSGRDLLGLVESIIRRAESL